MDQLRTEMETLMGLAAPAKLQMLVRVGCAQQPGLSPRRTLSSMIQPQIRRPRGELARAKDAFGRRRSLEDWLVAFASLVP
jgi:hypothetical protein